MSSDASNSWNSHSSASDIVVDQYDLISERSLNEQYGIFPRTPETMEVIQTFSTSNVQQPSYMHEVLNTTVYDDTDIDMLKLLCSDLQLELAEALLQRDKAVKELALMRTRLEEILNPVDT